MPTDRIEKPSPAAARTTKNGKVRYLEIARLAGVSQSTVSYVLSPRDDVSISAATRRKVLSVASKLSYRHNELARSLARGKTRTIGVLSVLLDITFYADLINGIQQACLESEYRVLLGYAPDEAAVERNQLQLLLQHQVDAVIIVPGYGTCQRLDHELGETLASEHTPCVVLDHVLTGGKLDYVVSDDRAGAASAVEHLVARGHRRVGFIGAGRRSSSATNRYEAYLSVMAAAGIPERPELIFTDAIAPEAAAAPMARMLDLAEPPTAVFAASDYLALGAFQAITARGMRVPQDVAVVGYSDAVFAQFLKLSTVRRSPIEMGRAATYRALERIENPDLPPKGIVLPTHLVVRGSTGGI